MLKTNRPMKRLAKLLTVGVAAFTMFSSAAWAQQKSIAVAAIVEHPALDAVRDGVQEVLAEAGYENGQNLRWQYQSAQGNTSTMAQIARKFIGDEPDVIIAISTPSAQTVIAATDSIPIIFAAVTDPVAARLTSSWEATGTNVTGVSDMLELDRQIDLILRIVPDAKRIGMVYNPSEANSVAVVRDLQALLEQRELTLVTAAAPRSVDVGSAARSLVGKVDVFYTNTDNNIVSAFEAMASVADEAQVPLIASDPDSVARGASAALGVDYKDIGRQAGRIAIRIFNGEAPGTIAPQTSENLQLLINPGAAQRQGITLPEDLLNEATQIID